jgi:hypothetical protein
LIAGDSAAGQSMTRRLSYFTGFVVVIIMHDT